MAAPNLRAPSAVTGKTATAALTTSLTAVLANASASGKVLKVNTVRAANLAAGATTVDLALVRSNSLQPTTRTRNNSYSSDVISGNVGTFSLNAGLSYWHKNNTSAAPDYAGTILEAVATGSFPVTVTITIAGTPVQVTITGSAVLTNYVRLDHPGFTSASGSTGDTWVLSYPDTVAYLLKSGSVDAGKTLITTDKNEYIYLEEGDELHAKASAGTSIDLTINYEEIS